MARVLVVDDDPDLARVCALVLISEGYDTDIAQNGAEAVDAVERDDPDVVLLDVMIPLINGLEVCRKVKENAQTDHLPVILMSASNFLLQGAGKVSADAVLWKPFDIDVLLDTVNRFVPSIP